MIERYFLGCPIWGNKTWVGELFRRGTKAEEFLEQYASVFNTVEGNTTFYGMPTEATVTKWRAATPYDFRFCFKFPRTISHDKRLVGAEAETEHFLKLMAPLGSRIGPFFLQLPPTFKPADLPTLERFLRTLPPNFPYAVEVRHPDFFDEGESEAELDALLRELEVDRVLFDTHALWTDDPNDPDVRAAQRKKPRLPVRATVTADRPFLRYVAHTNMEANVPILSEWAERVAGWILEGRTPYVFLHAPDDFYAPRLARLFHRLLSERLDVGTLPRWPADEEPPPLEQLALF